jgi:hypothetical protein
MEVIMPIVLSQRIDYESSYQDIPFVIYHYPKRYRNQITTGDLFLYYQGDRHKKENRYYFGYGVVGRIDSTADAEEFYAEIINGKRFSNIVPIYHPDGGFYESIAFSEVREKERPAWQNSIRKISNAAYLEILSAAGVNVDLEIQSISYIEKEIEPLNVLKLLNDKYQEVSPIKKEKLINMHIDRGTSVTNALKKILGPKCQICDCIGFEKRNGDRYIEAHHLNELAKNQRHSLCSDNVILVCPNCHREIHYGKKFIVYDEKDSIYIELGNKKAKINKNTISYLESLKK